MYFLTTNLPENASWDRDITKWLYSAEPYFRIAQEAILGIGGVRVLEALGEEVEVYHMNEGHSAFLTFELLKRMDYSHERVKQHCTFTTHTPVKAGHDVFDYGLAHQVMGEMLPWNIRELATEAQLSTTHLALNLSKKTNSVSERHQQVCEEMFPGYAFENVTNGIHHLRWASDRMAQLFDEFLPGWREDPELLLQAPEKLSGDQVWSANQRNKRDFIQWINDNQAYFSYWDELTDEDYFDEDTLTICFARRFVEYKRPGLIFHDLDALRQLGYRKLQLVFGGRCHPNDQYCNYKIGNLKKDAERLRGQIRVAVIPDYNIDIAQRMVSGADIWLNNPVIPYEASGTSGMKAALNGTLNLSILDGWWKEGFARCPEAGWGFGLEEEDLEGEAQDEADARSIYRHLAEGVECYYERRDEWKERMKKAISLVGFFNAQRCIEAYRKRLWSA